MVKSGISFVLAFVVGIAASQVTYVPGNTNIVITAPHGGSNRNINCPDRINGCEINGECAFDSSRTEPCPNEECSASTLKDSYTKEVAEDLVDLLAKSLGATPHLITMGAHRSVIDVNREINEACMGCKSCETLYNEYHSAIESAISATGKGILFDIHGQGHKQNSSELGYGISKWNIDKGAAGNQLQTESTIDALVTRSGLTLNELLFGAKSLGSYLQAEGFDALPSPTLPAAGQTDYKYFNGGYTVQTYHDERNFDAIQIEAPGEVRLTGLRKPYTEALARALKNFYVNFGYTKI